VAVTVQDVEHAGVPGRVVRLEGSGLFRWRLPAVKSPGAARRRNGGISTPRRSGMIPDDQDVGCSVAVGQLPEFLDGPEIFEETRKRHQRIAVGELKMSQDSKGTETSTPNEAEATPDAVYRETYTEMRHLRDYQFKSFIWHTTLLVAIFGFVVASRFGKMADALSFATIYWLKIFILILSILIAAISWYLIWYWGRSYYRLRHWTDDGLEPTWVKKSLKENRMWLGPSDIYYLTPFLLLVLIAVIIFWDL